MFDVQGMPNADIAKLAQFLSVLVRTSSAARNQVVDITEW